MHPSPPRPERTVPRAVIAAAAAVLVPVSLSGATLFQRDDFASGTTEGWAGGASPTVVATGGPAGEGDAFLRVGNGGSLATYHTGSAWSGDFAAAGITAITADLMAPADNPVTLEIRLVVLGPGTGTRWTSATAQVVPSDGVWRPYTFPIDEGALVRILGSATLAETLAAVDRTQFRHDPPPPMTGGEDVPGFLGLDNITSIPEPATPLLVLLAAGTAAFLRTGRRRRSCPHAAIPFPLR